ncbi:MAG: phage holin family protein [Pseudomonadota bacterium]
MLGRVRELARTALAIAETRAELAATELEEQALRWAEIALWLALAGFFLGAALVFVGILAVLLFWDSNRLLAAAIVGALFLGAGGLAGLLAGMRLRERPRLFSATVAELRKDRERIEHPAT